MFRLLVFFSLFGPTLLAQDISQTIEQLRQLHAPDKRVARFQITLDTTPSGQIVLRGETNLPEAYRALQQAVGSAVLDSIQLLPHPHLGDATFGIVRQSVANIRSQPKHSAELATQALLGTPLRVYKREGDWSLVQTPDGYISWLDAGGFQPMTPSELAAWQQSPRRVITADYAFIYSEPNPSSTRIADLVAGNILQEISERSGYVHLRYPDGRSGYVAKGDTRPLTDWLKRKKPSASAILTTAQQFLGRPYLWGGTSGKGMDCSGFTKTVYFMHGYVIPRDASQQVHTGREIPIDSTLSELTAGDFLFFGTLREDGSQRISHVGIYMGEGRFIHSGADNGAVAIQSLFPEATDFAPRRRETLLRVKRLRPKSDAAVVDVARKGSWYLGK